MTKAKQKKVIELLRNDEEYYNGVGKQYRSNSDIYKLLNDPEQFGKPTPNNINFLIGGYLHTAILEPEKLKANYPYVDATTRTTKVYKEAIAKSGKEMLLLKKEVDKCEEMITKILNNDVCTSLLKGDTINEEPGIKEINGTWWKGKADCINKDQGLLVDIKTTGDIQVDSHHSVEDTSLALGQAFAEALGDKVGIRRFGDAMVPLDEVLVQVAVDLSGRPYLVHRQPEIVELIGTFDTTLGKHIWESIVAEAHIALHIRVLEGRNAHHVFEAQFKAVARALRDAVALDGRVSGIPSTKGSL